MLYLKQKSANGFTIVELLIVIVVISILASITVVAYNGVQGRASDAAIQSDLRNAINLFQIKAAEGEPMPRTLGELSTVGLKATKTAYGHHMLSETEGEYNLLYCSTISGYQPEEYAFIARSKSGKVFAVQDEQIKELPTTSWVEGWGTMCPALLDVVAHEEDSSDGLWLYEESAWREWL